MTSLKNLTMAKLVELLPGEVVTELALYCLPSAPIGLVYDTYRRQVTDILANLAKFAKIHWPEIARTTWGGVEPLFTGLQLVLETGEIRTLFRIETVAGKAKLRVALKDHFLFSRLKKMVTITELVKVAEETMLVIFNGKKLDSTWTGIL